MGDFETTVYKGQQTTEVWASALVELGTEDVKIFHSIDETWSYIVSLNESIIVYYHNLKFDGSFWLYFFLHTLEYKQAYTVIRETPFTCEWEKNKQMQNKTFKYSISDMGQWYTITVKINNRIIEFRDSLKLLPFSVKTIGKSFGTKHAKLEMEYEGIRYPGCKITEEEKRYIANDVLVVKEALEIMFEDGHNKLTIGSCCLSEYKTIVKSTTKTDMLEYDEMFPDLYDIPLIGKTHRYANVGEYIRKSYKGGWCYLVKGKENKQYRNGVTADVNSLYPSVMHSMSGNEYPVGNPKFWTGSVIPEEALKPHRYYFIRVKTRFYLKEGYLPFIQIKGNPLYRGTEALETSDIYNPKTGKYTATHIDLDGVERPAIVELVLTCTDWILMQEHYNLVDCTILDGCYFRSMAGIFDEYIDKYAEIKKTSKGAKRTQAKLFLNNLYGKMACNTDSSFKVAQITDERLGFLRIKENNKTPGYIAVGSAITSYARNFTIRAAQKNYYGKDKPGFIYADTDSIHCDLDPSKLKGLNIHKVNFCCWDLESRWDVGVFARQKTYIEHVVMEEEEPIEEPYYNVKCAGMPERCKKLFIKSITGELSKEDYDKYTDNEQAFLFDKDTHEPIQRSLDDFRIGLKVPGKLVPKQIPGGVLLVETEYTFR